MFVIYLIKELQSNKIIYVGSTKNLKERIRHHKYSCFCQKNKDHNIKIYQRIRELGWENIYFHPLRYIDTDDKDVVRFVEGDYIRAHINTVLNTRIENRTREEYIIDNKEELNRKSREYHEKNREQLIKKKKEYNRQNREEINRKNREYRKKNKFNVI